MTYLFLNRLLLITLLIIAFYYYFKIFLFHAANKISIYFNMTRHYSVEMAKGVVELPLIVIMHFTFCLMIIYLLSIPIQVSIPSATKIIVDITVGIFLGIGMMGFSSLLCRAFIEILRHIPHPYFPKEVKNWLIMTRSGWLRHYFHTIEALPFIMSLPIVLGQVFCEELMFRGILIPYFLPAGPWVAIIVSTILFMFMQLFHLPSLLSGIFPMVGSLVIGLINSILYAKFFNLLPLVIAHFTFFIVAVL